MGPPSRERSESGLWQRLTAGFKFSTSAGGFSSEGRVAAALQDGLRVDRRPTPMVTRTSGRGIARCRCPRTRHRLGSPELGPAGRSRESGGEPGLQSLLGSDTGWHQRSRAVGGRGHRRRAPDLGRRRAPHPRPAGERVDRRPRGASCRARHQPGMGRGLPRLAAAAAAARSRRSRSSPDSRAFPASSSRPTAGISSPCSRGDDLDRLRRRPTITPRRRSHPTKQPRRRSPRGG